MLRRLRRAAVSLLQRQGGAIEPGLSSAQFDADAVWRVAASSLSRSQTQSASLPLTMHTVCVCVCVCVCVWTLVFYPTVISFDNFDSFVDIFLFKWSRNVIYNEWI